MDKKELRKEIRVRLSSLDKEKEEESNALICRALKDIIEVHDGITVLSYIAMDREADPVRFDRFVQENGGRVAYPVCGQGGSMEFYIADSEKSFSVNKYGIKEPDPASSTLVGPDEADVIIVPCVGFGKDLSRLGHGGGYYDRYFARVPGVKKVLIAFSLQQLEDIPMDTYDFYMDAIVTEKVKIERK